MRLKLERISAGAALVLTVICTFAQSPSGPTGRFGAVMEYDPSQPQTVYRPRDLTSPAATKIPIVAWGNGACADDGGAGAREFLTEVASHGYFVIVPGKPGRDVAIVPTTNRAPAPPPAPAPAAKMPPAPARPPGVDATQSSQLIDGINWAIRENARSGSIYFNRLDSSKVAVMGHSCGGLQALDVSSDPRIVTSVIFDSGIYIRPGNGRSNVRITKDKLQELHAPVAYINGGPTDIAYENGKDDFQKIDRVPAFWGELPVGHDGTFRQLNGGAFAKVAVGWLNWRLKNDRAAGAMFSGEKCGLCVDPDWTVERKRME
jgi:hypothetical protein